MTDYELSGLEEAISRSWSRETSSDPERWNPENPAWGQCAVTALVINDYLGGEMVWAEAKIPDGRGISHYFNLIDEQEVDLTRNQFPEGTVIPRGVEKKKQYASTKDYVLSFPVTQQRYLLLKQQVEEHLK
ncbi:MAG: hypothetical protein Q7S55_03260 [Nanoarchaeota archaeon]|nr:hypothetical protein [Nanoarchaeota archaeon]